MKRKATKPTCYASGYTLDLYCDHENDVHEWQEFPHQFTGESWTEYSRAARKRDWIVHTKTRTATGPRCTRR